MPYDPIQIANWFVERARREGRFLTIMSVLKLVYIAHGWFLEMRRRPLVQGRLEAWPYGPVYPTVYKAFKFQGKTIKKPVQTLLPPITLVDAEFLEQIYSIYGNMSAFQLSDLTHVAGGPWDITRQMSGGNGEIPNDLIMQHYDLKRAGSAPTANG